MKKPKAVIEKKPEPEVIDATQEFQIILNLIGKFVPVTEEGRVQLMAALNKIKDAMNSPEGKCD